jgi:hypothetical protein
MSIKIELPVSIYGSNNLTKLNIFQQRRDALQHRLAGCDVVHKGLLNSYLDELLKEFSHPRVSHFILLYQMFCGVVNEKVRIQRQAGEVKERMSELTHTIYKLDQQILELKNSIEKQGDFEALVRDSSIIAVCA